MRAAAWGEYRFGVGRGAQSLIAVFVGTGVGSGAVVDGLLLRGFNNAAGELGHTQVVQRRDARAPAASADAWRPTPPGAASCAASRPALAAGDRPRSRERPGAMPPALTGALVARAAAAGDAFAREIWNDAERYLGAGHRRLRHPAQPGAARAGRRRHDHGAEPVRHARAARATPRRRSWRARSGSSGRPRRLGGDLRRRRSRVDAARDAVARGPRAGSRRGRRGSRAAHRLGLGLGLAVVTLLSRWPYRARMLYNWDAVQFALALREFDVAKHQPHPPGLSPLRAARPRAQRLVRRSDLRVRRARHAVQRRHHLRRLLAGHARSTIAPPPRRRRRCSR